MIYPIVATLSLGLLTAVQGKINLADSQLQNTAGMFESRSALEPLNKQAGKKSMFDYEAHYEIQNLNQSSTAESCADDEIQAFNEKLADVVDPARNCRKIIKFDPVNQKEYCQCLSQMPLSKITPEDMNTIAKKLKEEANAFSEEIIRANISAIQDKLLAGIALHNQIKNKYPNYNNKCNPEQMVESVSKAGRTGSCANGKMKKLDSILAKSNAFDEILASATKLNHDTSEATLDNKNINQGIDDIVLLLQKLDLSKTSLDSISPKEIDVLREKLEVELKENPFFRMYKVEFYNPITESTEVINNLNSSRLGLGPQEDLMLIIRDKMKDNNFTNKEEVRKELSALFGDHVKNLKNLCGELQENIDFMCERAFDQNYSLSLIQNNPVHLAQIVRSVFIKFNPGEFKFEMEESNFGYRSDFMGAPKSYDNKILSERVDMLQCSFAFKDLSNSFILAGSKATLDPSLFALGEFTHPVQMTIGDSGRYKDLIAETNRFNPYKKLEKASEEQLLKTAIITRSTANIDNYRLIDHRNKRTSASELLNRTFGENSEYNRSRSSISSSSTKLSPVTSTTTSATTTSSVSNDSYSPGASSSSPNMTNYQTLPYNTNGNLAQNSIDQSTFDADDKKSSPQSVIDSYEKRLATMMEKLEALTTQRKEKAVAEDKKGTKTSTEVAPVAEETELKSTISKLKEQIATLQSKQNAIDTAKAKPATISTPATAKTFTTAPAKKRNHTTKPQSTESAPVQNYVAKATQKAANSQPTASYQSPSSSSNSGRDFTLRSESLSSEGKFVVSAKEFKVSDQKFISELYEKAAGQPVYVAQLLPDGSEEIILYEPTKMPDGTITYVAKKKEMAKVANQEKKPTEKAKEKEKSKPDDKRKRVKVQDLNQLIQTVK